MNPSTLFYLQVETFISPCASGSKLLGAERTNLTLPLTANLTFEKLGTKTAPVSWIQLTGGPAGALLRKGHPSLRSLPPRARDLPSQVLTPVPGQTPGLRSTAASAEPLQPSGLPTERRPAAQPERAPPRHLPAQHRAAGRPRRAPERAA